MKSNRMRERLEPGEAVCLANPTPFPSAKLVEMIGLIGFDGVWLDMEHQDYSFDDLFHMALACRATGMDSVARIRKGAYWSYFRSLEAGATGIMVPHCCSAEEARLAVRNARFHPHGARGLDGVEPHAQYGRASLKDYLDWANREILVSVQIEDREGVENIEEIVAVPGIDGVMVGPGDLSQSFGLPGPLQPGRQRSHRAGRRGLSRPGQVVGHSRGPTRAGRGLPRPGGPPLSLRRGRSSSQSGVLADLGRILVAFPKLEGSAPGSGG